MCGRYFINDKTAEQIDLLIRRAVQEGRPGAEVKVFLRAGDVCPTEEAPIVGAFARELGCRTMRWGLPGFQTKQVVFNARCESALEKKMFREGLLHRRIVIPAAGFYEWSKNREKNTFTHGDGETVFMAGFYDRFPDGDRFTILTTEANDSMKRVHDRMPLILEEDEVLPWILDPSRTEEFLHKRPGELKREVEFEQLSLF